MIPLPDQVRRSFSALMDGDDDTASRNCAADVTCHIGGQHPFTGEYRGVARITEMLRLMDEIGGGHSFTVTNVMTDDSGSQVLIEGVAMHGSFARHVIKRLRYDGGRLVELWIKPLDQRAEDEFWRAQVPHQRLGGSVPVDAEAGNGS
jgi:ketosteroid isomerase-like protein